MPPETQAGTAPLPAVTLDTLWWFQACQDQRLLIQRCVDCEALRHPPRPMCPSCRSVTWDHVEASGDGAVYSVATVHHPKVEGREYPLIVGLLDLAEGTRIVAELTGCEDDDGLIGRPVRIEWPDPAGISPMPRFRVV